MANNSKDLQLRELKDTISELNNLIRTLQATLDDMRKSKEASEQELKNAREEIAYLRKKLFGASSEKHAIDIPGQYNLFNEAESEQNGEAFEEIFLQTFEEPKKRKPRATNAERFKGLPVKKVYLDLEGEKACPECGTPLIYIGEEYVRRELHFTPAKMTVIEYYSKNYKCPECEINELPSIYKGKDGKAHGLYGMISAETIAWLMYQKFCNSLPFYRQEKDWKQYGVSITRATMANWVIKNSEAYLKPMYDFFRKKLLERKHLMADESPLQVLHEPERRAQTKSYMWLYRTGEDGEAPIVIYQYSETRAGENAVEFLENFQGYLMCDGYSGYNKVREATRTVCWAHIRRYLTEAIPKGKQLDYTQPSVQGMMYVNHLFQLEDKIKKTHNSFEAIKEARLEKEKPVIEAFLSWLDNQNPVRGSRMEKAVTYIRNRRDFLANYLQDGRCSFSNNLSENSIRPFTVGRNYVSNLVMCS
ncbi:MAG: IS66 family transposase [Tyzzerella sp.]|nr:IS66 family transposase [Tyzzerella sp.]